MIAALLLVAAEPDAAWVAGRWVPADVAAAGADACTGPEAVRYGLDGRYASAGDEGWWWLSRAMLRQQSGPLRIGSMFRIERLGADHMRLSDPSGEVVTWQRCR